MTRHDGSYFSRAANGHPISGVAAAYIPGSTSMTLGGVRVGSNNTSDILIQAFAVLANHLDDTSTFNLGPAMNKLLKYL